jgi:predicted NAD-dependent protein-ADP-ribosyltransferase YbiA (DUF1768 family)
MEYPCSIRWRHKSYPSAEHIFHVERFRNQPRVVEAVQQQLSSLMPKALQIYAYKNRRLEDPNWKYRDGPVLQNILEAKFQQNDNLRNILLEPKLKQIEFATRNERRYGIDRQGKGFNLLGRKLLQLRQKLLSQHPEQADI